MWVAVCRQLDEGVEGGRGLLRARPRALSRRARARLVGPAEGPHPNPCSLHSRSPVRFILQFLLQLKHLLENPGFVTGTGSPDPLCGPSKEILCMNEAGMN